MDNQEIELLFVNNGIRPTAVRMLIMQALSKMGFAFSISDVENSLDSVDRSTIFRTLILLEEHNLIHAVDDGSGVQKYCLKNEEEEMQHVHITCQVCHKTYCCKSVAIPRVALPDGFEVQEVSYVVKGVCGECQKKGKTK